MRRLRTCVGMLAPSASAAAAGAAAAAVASCGGVHDGFELLVELCGAAGAAADALTAPQRGHDLQDGSAPKTNAIDCPLRRHCVLAACASRAGACHIPALLTRRLAFLSHTRELPAEATVVCKKSPQETSCVTMDATPSPFLLCDHGCHTVILPPSNPCYSGPPPPALPPHTC
eukprot:364992-Chlamydomonas_euryale.AAC.1